MPTSVSNSDSGGVPRVGGGRGGGATGTQKAGGRPRGAGRRSRRWRPRGEEPSPGAPHRPGLLERPVWWPGTRDGWPGIPSRGARAGQLPDTAGDWPAPPGPHLRAALRSGSEQATYRAAQRKWLEFLPRRLARAWGGAGRTPEGACAGAARRWPGGGPPPSPGTGSGGGGSPGSAPGALGGAWARLPQRGPRPAQPPAPSTCLWLGCAGGGGHVGRGTSPLLIRNRASSLWGGWQHTQAWAPAQCRAEALRTEASASPSLHFGKALA